MKHKWLIILIVAMALIVLLIPCYLHYSGMLSQTSEKETTPGAAQDNAQDERTSTSPTEAPAPPGDADFYDYKLVDGRPMLYAKDGTPAEAGWIDDPGTEEHLYYCKGNGELVTGWKYLEGKVWYFYQEEDGGDDRKVGSLARSYTTSGGFEIPETGYFDGDEGLAMAYGLDVLNRYGSDLESAYRYSASLRFVEREDLGGDTKIHEAALIGFETGEGNCMVWSGTFCVMARLLGYDCRLIWGTLTWNGTTPHAWTEIWEEGDDEPHVYDPRKNEGNDMSGFDKRYGQKGTYKYNEDSKVYLEW